MQVGKTSTPLSREKETFWLTAALLVLILFSFFLNLGTVPLFDIDEGVFCEATREMAVNKNYITTFFNGALRFDKPILFYWLQLGSIKLLGQNEFAFRLPSAIAGSAWALSVFFFMRREIGNRTAFLASAIMVLSLQITVIAKASLSDAVLNCFIALSMLSLLRHYTTGSKHSLLIVFGAAALGMLTKGPIAVMIPVAVSFLFSLWEGTLKSWFKMVFYPPGIVLFLCIALPWYILEYREQGMAFIEGFFVKHNYTRFSSTLEGRSGSFFYYLPVLIVGMMPFTGLLISAILNIRTLLTEKINRFLFIWFALVFVFFSFSGTKLHHYIIYGYTPLFILMARSFPLDRNPRLSVVWPTIFFAFIALLPLIIPEAMHLIKFGYFTYVLQAAAGLIGHAHVVLTVTAALLVIIIQFLPKLSPPAKLLATGVVFILFVNLYLFPLAGKLLQEPVKEAALLSKKEGYKTILWRVRQPSFLVYSESLAEMRDPLPGEIVLTTADELVKTGKKVVLLYSKYGIVLAKIMN
ncbi:MAG: glycosyltransferase family 39 protein [Chlorobiaceae bacterium]|nr:glycosyltransferase family 39 protein [Chlorobiaceae bacterium]